VGEAKITQEIMLIIDKLRQQLGNIHLRCSCVNWMGGCHREACCSLGWLRDSSDTLKNLQCSIERITTLEQQLAERDQTIARLKKVEQKYVNLLAENIIEFSGSDPELWGTFQNENADLLKRLRNTLLAARAKETEC
jgi:restriction endonuclease S subunit